MRAQAALRPRAGTAKSPATVTASPAMLPSTPAAAAASGSARPPAGAGEDPSADPTPAAAAHVSTGISGMFSTGFGKLFGLGHAPSGKAVGTPSGALSSVPAPAAAAALPAQRRASAAAVPDDSHGSSTGASKGGSGDEDPTLAVARSATPVAPGPALVPSSTPPPPPSRDSRGTPARGLADAAPDHLPVPAPAAARPADAVRVHSRSVSDGSALLATVATATASAARPPHAPLSSATPGRAGMIALMRQASVSRLQRPPSIAQGGTAASSAVVHADSFTLASVRDAPETEAEDEEDEDEEDGHGASRAPRDSAGLEDAPDSDDDLVGGSDDDLPGYADNTPRPAGAASRRGSVVTIADPSQPTGPVRGRRSRANSVPAPPPTDRAFLRRVASDKTVAPATPEPHQKQHARRVDATGAELDEALAASARRRPPAPDSAPSDGSAHATPPLHSGRRGLGATSTPSFIRQRSLSLGQEADIAAVAEFADRWARQKQQQQRGGAGAHGLYRLPSEAPGLSAKYREQVCCVAPSVQVCTRSGALGSPPCAVVSGAAQYGGRRLARAVAEARGDARVAARLGPR